MSHESSEPSRTSIFSSIEDVGDTSRRWDLARRVVQWKGLVHQQWTQLTDDPLVVVGLVVLSFFVGVAIFAPVIAPYGPTERLYHDGGVLIARWATPSLLGGEGGYLLGTTAQGYDIFSQLVYGARPALVVGFVAAFFTVVIGTTVGLVAGYYGGFVDDALMRLVDFVYGLPLLPTVIVLVAILGPGIGNVVLALVLLQWRTSARVIRSQVLSLRTRPFIDSARVAGASDWRIITRHIAPNVVPLAFLYGAFGIAWAILTEAGVSFIGLGDPSQVSWGTMLQNARLYNSINHGAWWWIVPPGVCIGLVVVSGFLIGRGYEEIVNPELRN